MDNSKDTMKSDESSHKNTANLRDEIVPLKLCDSA